MKPKRAQRSSRQSRGAWAAALGALAVALGVAGAVRLAWLCDDAFISFRYADNLVRGLGLVYNAGERVEGYSNFLWTLFTALGLRLGLAPEAWTVAWGVVFYAGTLALLCFRRPAVHGLAPGALALPVAGLVAAVHRDWNIYATSGLETSCFTFLFVLAYVLAADAAVGAWAAGLAVGLAALTRPDGFVVVPVFAAWMAWARPRRWASLLGFLAGFGALWLPYVAWKLRYYGDFLPNTYYAKSAGLAWWSQGFFYVGLYFRKYVALAAALPLALVAWTTGRRRRGARGGEAPAGVSAGAATALAAALAAGFTLYVARVGGDFMFARMLIPATPFYAIVLEAACLRLAAGRRGVEAALAAGLVAVTALVPYPFSGSGWQGGIVNERDFYKDEDLWAARREGAVLRRYFAGLPVSIAIVGSQARLAYYAHPAVAIEAQTGLTDRWIARQPLAHRGRVGHEKLAPFAYLHERRVDFVIQHFPTVALGLGAHVPAVPIVFDDVLGYMVRWDPPLLAELARRGAQFPDFPIWLDGHAATLDSLSAAARRAEFDRIRAFYFDGVADSARERRYRALVAAAAPPPARP